MSFFPVLMIKMIYQLSGILRPYILVKRYFYPFHENDKDRHNSFFENFQVFEFINY